MTAPTFLQLVPAFFLGCILTEIRWIIRMRQLRGPLGRREPANELLAAHDSVESLRNLSQQLAAEALLNPAQEPSGAPKS